MAYKYWKGWNTTDHDFQLLLENLMQIEGFMISKTALSTQSLAWQNMKMLNKQVNKKCSQKQTHIMAEVLSEP